MLKDVQEFVGVAKKSAWAAALLVLLLALAAFAQSYLSELGKQAATPAPPTQPALVAASKRLPPKMSSARPVQEPQVAPAAPAPVVTPAPVSSIKRIRVTSAAYGYHDKNEWCQEKELTERLQRDCDDLITCSMKIDSGTCPKGDPSGGNTKKFIVRWRCVDAGGFADANNERILKDYDTLEMSCATH